MVLTSKQREKLVLDLYGQGKTIKEIAKEAKMSFRDIGSILKEAGKQEEHAQLQSISSQALFSEGKTALQVAIALNLRDNEVTKLYNEYCNLTGLDSLCAVYREVKGDIWPFVNFYSSAKSSGMNVSHVTKLLTIANYDLPALENKYESLKRKVGDLKVDIRNSTLIFQGLSDQISSMNNTLSSIRLELQREGKRLHELYQKSIRQEALVLQFENDNEHYSQIKKTVEEKLTSLLSAAKPLLRSGFSSLIESMKNDPRKYRSLVSYVNQHYYDSYMNGKQQQYYCSSDDTDAEACTDMLIDEETNKIYNKLTEGMVDKVIEEYSSSNRRQLPQL